MTDPISIATLAIAGLAAISILSFAALRGWRGWLDLQRMALNGPAQRGGALDETTSVARIELADLRERVRKLEAIAAGVDL